MKNLPLIIISALAVALIIIFTLRGCDKDTAEIGYIPDSTQYWKNKYGQTVASLKQREADFNVAEKGWKDSIAKIHNTTAKRIEAVIIAYQQGQVSLPPQGKPEIIYVKDSSGQFTIKELTQLFLNPYYFANATISVNGDSSRLDLITYDTLQVLTKQVKEGGLFNPKTYYQIDITNRNPHNLITGIKAYRIPTAKPKKFGIGPQFGFTLDGSGKVKPYMGVGIHYSPIRF
jgi:hypothetical protein